MVAKPLSSSTFTPSMWASRYYTRPCGLMSSLWPICRLTFGFDGPILGRMIFFGIRLLEGLHSRLQGLLDTYL